MYYFVYLSLKLLLLEYIVSAVLGVKFPTVCIPLGPGDRRNNNKKVRIVFLCVISLIPELDQSLGV